MNGTAVRRAISFEDVSKRFNSQNVLRGVSFEMPEGEALCILGRSGTGKSVTLRLMIGLLQPDEGAIYIEDDEISRMDEDGLSRVRRKVGFLFQNAALFDSFTLNDNLAIPLRRLSRKSPEEINTLVNQTLEELGLGRDGDKMPAELSGGMRKRAGLARALVLDPRILLVDEPSSGLDRVTSSEIDSLLLDLKKRKGTTMVIVTHDIRGARKVGDRFAVLDGGKLLAIGTPAELENNENELVRALVSETT